LSPNHRGKNIEKFAEISKADLTSLLCLNPAFLHASPLSCCGSQFRPDGDEAARQDQAAADKMLRPEGLSEQNHS
jgi:hypothetical protein